ncbi:MAG TPA: protein-disulfide reductase DsbD domain-containing protein [Saprospiraceae bacterium]|nr:protein-disulfide reductase DsbD domain-containing protein [Saprospiraceae bacterium]
MKLLFSLLCVCIMQMSFAQSDKVVKWTASVKKESANTYLLTLNAAIDKGFYVYSQFLESQDGPVKTTVTLDQAADISGMDKATEDGHKKEGFDAVFGMNLIKYSDHLIIVKRIHSKTALDKISGTIEFMSCNDEMCYPPTEVAFRAPISN